MTDLAPPHASPSKRSMPALFLRWDTGPFLWSIMAAIGAYVVILLTWAVSRFHPLPALEEYNRVLTVICCVGMVGHVITGLMVMRRNDEFMRGIIGKRVTIAAFVTFGFLTIWGLLTNVGWAPQFPLMFAYGVFLLVHTALIPFINAERP